MPNPNEAAQAAAPAPESDQTVAEQVEAPAAEQLDAFSAGVEEARAAETSEAAPAVVPPADDGAPAAVEGEGDTPAAAADGDQPAAAAAAAPAAAPAAVPAQPEAPKSVDDEIKDLGITNERTQKRFRELSERASEAESLRDRAGKVTDWEQTIERTGTNPQQFGATLLYLTDINSGDPARMNRAYDTMQAELQFLGQKLGREAPGFDPLSAHPDLAEKVRSGDLERAAAVELVQHRQRGVLQTEHQQTQHQRQQAEVAEQQGLQAVAAIGQQLRATDPQFEQKFAFLAPTVDIIQNTLPPAQWAAAIQQAYQRLPALPAAAPAVAARPNNPARASAAPAVPATPKNPADAFSFGVAEAQAQGR
ncbi:hypothetical protein [Stenotrophomonas sp. VV52]|uniref:hypothetical protein n=1 Tax=Stenotrophomonas sp. VV52 TaxID=2066958 RepID=UPI000C9E0E1A|nr:hypothetical protein [Stenotrophomonas sp. VV52]